MGIRAVLICAAASVTALLAQDVRTQPIYRLNFSVTEHDSGHVTSDRKYSILVADQNTGRIHAGVRIPYVPSESHMNMANIGVIIECKLRSTEPDVSVDCSLESSSVMAKQPSVPPGYPPVVDTIQSRVSTVLRLGTQTLLATLDDPVTNRRVEFQVTAVKQ